MGEQFKHLHGGNCNIRIYKNLVVLGMIQSGKNIKACDAIVILFWRQGTNFIGQFLNRWKIRFGFFQQIFHRRIVVRIFRLNFIQRKGC